MGQVPSGNIGSLIEPEDVTYGDTRLEGARVFDPLHERLPLHVADFGSKLLHYDAPAARFILPHRFDQGGWQQRRTANAHPTLGHVLEVLPETLRVMFSEYARIVVHGQGRHAVVLDPIVSLGRKDSALRYRDGHAMPRCLYGILLGHGGGGALDPPSHGLERCLPWDAASRQC